MKATILWFSLLELGFAQTPSQDLVARLTPEQKQLFDDGSKAFGGQRYADALADFKKLLAEIPGDPVLSKFASEAALNTGDDAFALATLKPLSAGAPDDWQAAALLARACAESGDKPCRDAGMAHMVELHRRGIAPSAMKHYVVERVQSGENTLLIRPSLEPWGPYNVYELCQVMGKDGKIFLRITLESNDADQPFFAKEHPKEAAGGMREFSLDGYRETGVNSDGQRTQTHMTFKFFVGQPSYDDLREEFVKVAAGKENAMTSRTGLAVQR
jgi:hypothetical protein